MCCNNIKAKINPLASTGLMNLQDCLPWRPWYQAHDHAALLAYYHVQNTIFNTRLDLTLQTNLRGLRYGVPRSPHLAGHILRFTWNASTWPFSGLCFFILLVILYLMYPNNLSIRVMWRSEVSLFLFFYHQFPPEHLRPRWFLSFKTWFISLGQVVLAHRNSPALPWPRTSGWR
jgi:hypothetical protein